MAINVSAKLLSRKSDKKLDSSISRIIRFDDFETSDIDDGELSIIDTSSSKKWSPKEYNQRLLWDSGLGSPSLESPCLGNVNSRNSNSTSPIPFKFDSDDEGTESPKNVTNGAMPPTPPHNKFRSLRLQDTPQTPKSLLQRAHRMNLRSRNLSSLSKNQESKFNDPNKVQANVNPFNPVFNAAPNTSGVKRNRSYMCKADEESSFEEDIEEDFPTAKKLALHEINTSRYNEEFFEEFKLGDGEFGSVYRCINRLDGCKYAIKKSKMPVAGSAYERSALNEVYAHAVLGKHEHVVRYYSAWTENDHMFIQNEYCNGGSLSDVISENNRLGRCLPEGDLKRLLVHVALGLRFIHSQSLVHLDIKPGNIFIHRSCNLMSPESGLEEDYDEEVATFAPVVYKIGDLGHVTSIVRPLVEEGDCRYLPIELLQEKYDHLPKADIFSLGLTVFEAGGGGELPKNGEHWHSIRNCQLPELLNCSQELNSLLQVMVHLNPCQRPSASTLVQHKTLSPFGRKTKAQLCRELNEEKLKNELLARKLQEATNRATSSANGRSSRLIGKGRVNRSTSLTNF